jgi:hypothetical protein
MVDPEVRRPTVVPELEYTVRNGISGAKLIEGLATMVEADAAAIRISLDATSSGYGGKSLGRLSWRWRVEQPDDDFRMPRG